jgi:DNA invertase Pin-like site-specific DNA recombinase
LSPIGLAQPGTEPSARVATYEDAGISGAKGRDKRPGFDRLMMAVARREIDMVAAWSVDRLGRSLTDLLGFLTDLHAKRVDLFLHQHPLTGQELRALRRLRRETKSPFVFISERGTPSPSGDFRR